MNKIKKNNRIRDFRLNAKKLFLTYPYVENKVTLELLKKFIILKFKNIEWYIIAEENADDDHDYRHFHILISLNKQVDICNKYFLDLNEVHGNYQTVKNLLNVFEYVTKDENWKIYSINKTEKQINQIRIKYEQKLFNQKRIDKNDRFLNELYNSVCIEQDVTLLSKKILNLKYKENISYSDLKLLIQFIKNRRIYDEVKKLLHKERSEIVKPVYVYRNYLLAIYIWLIRRNKFGEPYTFFLQGPAGIGKTSLIQQLVGEEGIFIQHKDMLKNYDSDKHKYIIYDDINTKGIDRSNLIYLTDSEQDYQADVKNDMIVVKKGTTKLMLSNKKVDEVFPKGDDAIARRLFKCKFANHILDYEINTKYYSDVFGDEIHIYYKSDLSYFYNIVVRTDKQLLIHDEKLGQELFDKGERYLLLNYGMLYTFSQNISVLERLLHGSKENHIRIKFEICKKILDKQVETRNYHIDNNIMQEILDQHVKGVSCICLFKHQLEIQKLPSECLICWSKKFVKEPDNWYKV